NGRTSASLAGSCSLGRQGQYGQRWLDRARARSLSASGPAGHRGARGPPLSRHGESGRTVRASQPQRPQLPAARRPRWRGYHLAQDGRSGQGLLDRVAPNGDPGAGRAGPESKSPTRRPLTDILLAARDAGVLTLTLNRPDKCNALSRELIDALRAAADQADLDSDVQVVVIRGAGRDFCAGLDLAELLGSVDRSFGDNKADALRLGELFLSLRRMPKPVIAAVRGNALAGG